MATSKKKLTPEEHADIVGDFLEFSKYLFKEINGFDMIVTDYHIKICEAMEKVLIGETKRLIINVMPRIGKTQFAVINFMSWAMGLFPSSKFIHISYSADLSANNSYQVRDIVQHEAYKTIFPNVQLKKDSNARNHWKTTDGGVVYATSSLGQLTGFGAGDKSNQFAGAIIIDDPLKAQAAHSETERQKINDWFTQTLYSRINSPDTPIVVIMQRLAVSDLTGFLLEGGNKQKWDLVCLPALDENDESLIPEFLPTDELRRMREADPLTFTGQYQQLPIVKGGNLMKEHWLRWYNQYSLPEIEHSYITVDTAQKTKEQNDFTVFQHWAKCVDGNIYMLNMLRGKWEVDDLEVQFEKFYTASNSVARVRACHIEDKSSGTGLIQKMRKRGFPIRDIQRNTDKVARCYDASPWIAQGNVYLNKDTDQIGWLVKELVEFPNSKHDDTLDPMFDAIDIAFHKGQGKASVSYGSGESVDKDNGQRKRYGVSYG